MAISLTGIKHSLQHSFQAVAKNSAKFAHRTVKIYQQALAHVRINHFSAGATIVGANLLFTITADRIVQLMFKIFGGERSKSMSDIKFMSIYLGSEIALMTSLNIPLYFGLKSPLSPLVTAAISTATYVCFTLLRFSKL